MSELEVPKKRKHAVVQLVENLAKKFSESDIEIKVDKNVFKKDTKNNLNVSIVRDNVKTNISYVDSKLGIQHEISTQHDEAQ